jgi:hypothetical protein
VRTLFPKDHTQSKMEFPASLAAEIVLRMMSSRADEVIE